MEAGNYFALLDDDAPKKKVTKAVEPEPVKKAAPRAARPESARAEGAGKGKGRGRGEGRGRGGKGKGGADGERRPRREFDRHESGTGKLKNDTKKGGAGKHNWGKEGETDGDKPRRANRPRKEKTETSDEPAEEDATVAEGEAAEAEATAEPETPAEPEPEDNTLTLAEYLAQKKTLEGDKKTARTVVNDDSAFKAGKALKKDDEANEYALPKNEGGEASKKLGSKKTKGGKISFDAFIKDAPSGGRGGKGRGGDRGGKGGKGRGNDRGQRFALNDDQFPTLGGK